LEFVNFRIKLNAVGNIYITEDMKAKLIEIAKPINLYGYIIK
jgi:hypothetical protein